jgi:hypothetical protein
VASLKQISVPVKVECAVQNPGRLIDELKEEIMKCDRHTEKTKKLTEELDLKME